MLLLAAALLFLLPPQISDFLSCHVDVVLRGGGSNFYLSGEMAMNALQDKLFLSLYGDNPQHYWYKTNLSIVVSPDGEMLLDVWKWQDGKCELHTLPPDQVPPLSVPNSSLYLGNKTVSGVNCEVWRVPNPYPQVEYTDVSVSGGNVYFLESQTWTFSDGTDKLSVYIWISLSNHSNIEPDNSRFAKPEGC